MTDELGITGELLDAVGGMSGQTFCLLPMDGPPALDAEDSAAATTLRALEADVARADDPCFRRTDDGRWFGGVAVPLEGQRRLLYACLGPGNGSPEDHRRQAFEVLRCVLGVAREREESVAESRQLAEELGNAYEDLHLFARIATQIRSLRYSGDVLQDLLQETRAAMRVDLAAAVFESGDIADVIVEGPGLNDLIPEPGAFLATLNAEMAQSAPAFEGNCFIVSRSPEHPAFAAMHPRPFRALAIAIRNGDRQYGSLMLVSFNMDEIFRRGEYRLLGTMARQLALVMANTDLYRDMETFVINLVRSFVTAIEAKDPYTKGHSERVCRLCMRMGEALQLDQVQRDALKWASVLHDVGKIGTPETILTKPDRLSEREYDTIKGHPAKGAQILSAIVQLADALPAIRHHHERHDGKGYPDGLAGEEIPLAARIIAVADTYDAVTSTRAYRPCRTHADAMRIIHECRGTQFDPHIVDIFSPILEQGFETPGDADLQDVVPSGTSDDRECHT